MGFPLLFADFNGVEVSISQAIICGFFPSAVIAKAIPEIMPPPPKGTTITSTSGHWEEISSPIPPLPIITSSSATG